MSNRSLILIQVDGTPGDGAGRAGVGVVVRDGAGRVLQWRGGCVVAQTNNEAEYEALLFGLRLALAAYRGRVVRCLSDSRLVVDQLNGRAVSHTAALQQRYTAARRLCEQLGQVEVCYVPRAVNQLADALAWEALGGVGQLLRWANGQGGACDGTG